MISERHKILASRASEELKLALIEIIEEIIAQDNASTKVGQDEKLATKNNQVATDEADLDACNMKHADIPDIFQFGESSKNTAMPKPDMYGQLVWPAAESKPSDEVTKVKEFLDATGNQGKERIDAIVAVKSRFITADDEAEAHAQQIDTYAQSAEKTTENEHEVETLTQEQAISQLFSNNKLVTFDKVAKARARIKSKLGTLNSGLEPELLVDGATIAVAYIEAGVRKYSAYAAAMINDFGNRIKPFLRDFYEGACYYLGLDIKGMTVAGEINATEDKETHSATYDEAQDFGA